MSKQKRDEHGTGLQASLFIGATVVTLMIFYYIIFVTDISLF